MQVMVMKVLNTQVIAFRQVLKNVKNRFSLGVKRQPHHLIPL